MRRVFRSFRVLGQVLYRPCAIELIAHVSLRPGRGLPGGKSFSFASPKSGKPSPLPSPRGRGRKSESAFLSHPVLAGLEKVEGDGLKNLDVRRLRSWLVSKFSGSFSFFKEPRSGPDCGSPFFSLGFFGEAKKSKSPAGASPGMLARCNLLQPKRNLRSK
jgi:hypothetical protein